MDKKPWKDSLIQFIKFGLVGVSNTLVSLAVYYLFYFIDQRLYLVGNVVGWIVSVANSFYWNNRFVFSGTEKGRGVILKKLLKTYFSYGATFLLSTLMLYVEVDILAWSGVLCPVLNLIVTIPLNFLLNKYWAFAEGKDKEDRNVDNETRG